MTTPNNEAPPSNFLRSLIQRDLASQSTERSGYPGVITRFPPEPNGYLHIGHAKSIVINFGLAAEFGGRCHLRFDDTNPEKESQEYVEAIKAAVHWLGYRWEDTAGNYLYFASDYFQQFFDMACALIQSGDAYVDSQNAEDIRHNRGNLTTPGVNSPYRNRSATESLTLFEKMRSGACAEGEHVLRARIDMASNNINLRDPVLYRIRHTPHHRTGDAWPIYPMYDFAHPLSDAIECVTHSFCTLEFEDHRPFYNWVLEKLAALGFFKAPLPRQTEFARLNLTGALTSKRKLLYLVEEKIVRGWDDPRLPTLAGLRRRGYTPAAIRLFCERAGVAKADSWIDGATLEGALREVLEEEALRSVAVLRPVLLELRNWEAVIPNDNEPCTAPLHPHHPERGQRHFSLTRQLWIDADDVRAAPTPGFFRLYPGNRVRLRYGFVVECVAVEEANGVVSKVVCDILPNSKSGTPGADQWKVKGNIHWLSTAEAIAAQFRLYQPLIALERPNNVEDVKAVINPTSEVIQSGFVGTDTANLAPGTHAQFERLGYFVADEKDHRRETPVFNLSVALKADAKKKG